MPDPQVANLGAETDLVAPKGASFHSDGPSTYGLPQNADPRIYGPHNFGQPNYVMPYGQPTYGPHQNFGP